MEKPAQRIYGIDPQFYKRVVTGENTHPTNGYFGIKCAASSDQTSPPNVATKLQPREPTNHKSVIKK